MIWSDRRITPLIKYIFLACVIAVLGIPGILCSDDSLRSALEAISDKIGETPSRIVYLRTGNFFSRHIKEFLLNYNR